MYDIHNTYFTFLFWLLVAADPHKKGNLSPASPRFRIEINQNGQIFWKLNKIASFLGQFVFFGAESLLQVKVRNIGQFDIGQSRSGISNDQFLDLPFWCYDLDFFCSCWRSTLYNGLHNLFVRPFLPVQPTHMKLFCLFNLVTNLLSSKGTRDTSLNILLTRICHRYIMYTFPQ